MNKKFKLSTKMKILVSTVLSVYAFFCIFTGLSLSVKANTLEDIVSPTGEFVAVAQYEFKDKDNIGKDTLGNYDLVSQGVEMDSVIGGVALKNGGVLYANDLDGKGTDFSDLIKGSYSISLRAYLRSVSDGANYLVSTGSYGSNFQINWAYQGISMAFATGQTAKFGTSATDLGGKAMFDDTFAWYRITMIYDESNLTFRMLVTKESDQTYSFDATANLTSAVTFGGHANSFTIGAQSKFGGSIAQQVNTNISDGTTNYTIYPNLSELRVYAGVIDQNEISAIAKYDEDNLTASSSGYSAIAHYEFKFPLELGKDSLGNYDLLATDGVTPDLVNGGVVLGGTSGVLYASKLYPKKAGTATEGYVDYSDLITGSYSISMRAYLRSVNDGANYLVSTGSYGSNFQMNWAYQGFGMNFGNGQSAKFGTASTDLGGKAMLNATFSWYRITMIYDESNLTFRMLVTKEGDQTYSFDATANLTSAVTFGGHANSLTFGGQSNFGNAVAQHVSTVLTADETTIYPSVSDIRIYKGAIDGNEISAIAKYDADNLKDNDPSSMKQMDVKPVAWYEFNDANNLGKDSMGNFDLKVGGKGIIEHDEDGFVTFTKANESFLYAPYLYGAVDYSDLLTGGYTVSVTINADNTVMEGNRYAITTASYGAGFCLVGSNNGYRLVYSSGGDRTHSTRYETGSLKDKWVNLTITADKENKEISFYVDGLLYDQIIVDDYQGFSKVDEYVFAIGAQAKGTGKNSAQYFEGKISDVKVYDFALSQRNVKDMYDNANTDTPFSSVVNYDVVESISVDTESLDLIINENNSLDDVLAGLPTTVVVKDSEKQEQTCSVVWLGFNDGVIRGYVKGTLIANAGCVFAEVQPKYVIDMATATNGQYSEVTLNDQPFTSQPLSYGENNVLKFKVNVENGYKLSYVAVNNQRVTPDSYGVYTVDVNDYAKVSFMVAPEEYVITYVLNNGSANEEQIYGYGETVILADYFTKQGFVFVGWYDNENLEGEAISTVDSLNPQDITLYAKWEEAPQQNQGGQPSGGKGCNGGISGVWFVLPLCLSAIAIIKRKKGD